MVVTPLVMRVAAQADTQATVVMVRLDQVMFLDRTAQVAAAGAAE
jgi:hypothetical protein